MFLANDQRYATMQYRRCGNSGIRLPFLSLGLWHNFGESAVYENARQMVLGSFDLGITHFDLANNYGPPPGSAEETFGRILKKDLAPYRDEMIISTKAGYYMWPGPYGDWGSKKYLVSSLDQSLRRMALIMSISSTITGPIPTHCWKKQWKLWLLSSGRERHCM